MREQRLDLYELPDYKSRRNKTNDYGFDPHEQATETYTGMGLDINVHDQWAVESMGAIQDRTREHLGQSDKAIADLDKAIDLNPKQFKAHVNRGAVYATKGRLDEAIADYNEAEKLRPTDPEPFYRRGLAYRQKGEIAKARADLKKALRLMPHFPEAKQALEDLKSGNRK